MNQFKPFVDLPPGSPEWSAYQNLRILVLQIERWRAANPTFTHDDSDTLYQAMLAFVCNRISHTSVWERSDVMNLIQRSIGQLSLILHVSSTDGTVPTNFGLQITQWIHELHKIICQIPEDAITAILETSTTHQET